MPIMVPLNRIDIIMHSNMYLMEIFIKPEIRFLTYHITKFVMSETACELLNMFGDSNSCCGYDVPASLRYLGVINAGIMAIQLQSGDFEIFANFRHPTVFF